jgi:hypothetical protein
MAQMEDKSQRRKIAGDPLDFRLDRHYIVVLSWLFTSLRFAIPGHGPIDRGQGIRGRNGKL